MLTDNAAIAAYAGSALPRAAAAGPDAAGEGGDRELELARRVRGPAGRSPRRCATARPRWPTAPCPGRANYAQIPELAQRGRPRVQQFFATLDERLRAATFIAAGTFQHRRHHRRGGGGLRARREGQAGRAAPAPAALARGDGAAAVDVALAPSASRNRSARPPGSSPASLRTGLRTPPARSACPCRPGGHHQVPSRVDEQELSVVAACGKHRRRKPLPEGPPVAAHPPQIAVADSGETSLYDVVLSATHCAETTRRPSQRPSRAISRPTLARSRADRCIT